MRFLQHSLRRIPMPEPSRSDTREPSQPSSATRARGGRPSKWSDEKVAIITDVFGRQLRTKRAAAKAAGIGYQTLMDWQRQRPEWFDALLALQWHTRLERGAERERWWLEKNRQKMQRRAQAIFGPRPKKKRPAPQRDQPTKQMRLVCWRLTHHVHPEDLITEQDERDACAHFRLLWENWIAAKERFPQMMEQVRDRRARRLRYGQEHGRVPIGWTPPKPGKRPSWRYSLWTD